MTDLNYREDLEIDNLDLVNSWMVQASLYGKWSELWADASYRVDKLTEKRKIKRAKIYVDVKLNPHNYEWLEEKAPTEGFIDAQTRLDKDFKKITKDLIEAKRDMNVLQSAKESFYHKRKSLEHLSDLTPPEHPQGRKAKELDQKAAMAAQKQALRKTKGEK